MTASPIVTQPNFGKSRLRGVEGELLTLEKISIRILDYLKQAQHGPNREGDSDNIV